MRLQDILPFDLATWGPWLAPAAGLLAAGVVFWLGRSLFVRRGEEDTEDEEGENLEEGGEVDPFLHGATRERRGALRRGGNPVPVLITDANGEAEPLNAWVIDRSTGGLCLSVHEAIATGTVLSVRTSNAPQTVPWIQVEVKNCRPVGSDWELGCKFVRTPPWSVLLLFG